MHHIPHLICPIICLKFLNNYYLQIILDYFHIKESISLFCWILLISGFKVELKLMLLNKRFYQFVYDNFYIYSSLYNIAFD